MFGALVLGRVAIDRHLENASVAVAASMENSFLSVVFLKQLQGCFGLIHVNIITGLE